MTPSIKSRVYHTIANTKKQLLIQRKKWKNDFKIECISSNDYKLLSEADLSEVVKYETIAEHIK